MSRPLSVILGKAVRKVAKLRGGSGSALPGLFVEKIDPNFIKRTLGGLPLGVVLVSGTNGKTTTTKMIVELLEGQGLRVFTNRTGSNFTRGVAAALLGEIDIKGRLEADIAVLELDEAHAVHFVHAVKPRHTLLLNVLRDQLDRFGEIDYTASLLEKLAENTTESLTVNREDSHLREIGGKVGEGLRVKYFGLSQKLEKHFPSEEDLHGQKRQNSTKPEAIAELVDFDGQKASYILEGARHSATLKLSGAYNLFNAAAAMATVANALNGKYDQDKLIDSLAKVKPAFGRGETLNVNGQPLELVLVKNPSGFRLGLSSFDPAGYDTMIAINDNYADGRDMSWLWDVDFTRLQAEGVKNIAGMRCYDMALRLEHDAVYFGDIDEDLAAGLKKFITQNNRPKRIYCTYTAMLALRRELNKYAAVEEIDR